MEEEKEVSRFRRSLRHAIDGIIYAVSHEKNFRIEIAVAFLVAVFVFVFQMKSWEVIVLIVMIMWVLVLELTNTVVERIVDILKPRIHPYARLVKDLMAAAVLISAIASIIVGLIIFYPYVRDLVILFQTY